MLVQRLQGRLEPVEPAAGCSRGVAGDVEVRGAQALLSEALQDDAINHSAFGSLWRRRTASNASASGRPGSPARHSATAAWIAANSSDSADSASSASRNRSSSEAYLPDAIR